jgi:Flp pilus assembly protein TadD
VNGDYEKAIEAAKKMRQSSTDKYLLSAASYVRLGRLDEARVAVAKALELHPGISLAKVRPNYAYSDPALLDRQLADLAKAGLPDE